MMNAACIRSLSFALFFMVINRPGDAMAHDAPDMEVCKVWREGGDHWWSPQATYCCKDCCLTTLGGAEECTAEKCSQCTKTTVVGECQNILNSYTGEITTEGCNENQFCQQPLANSQ